MQTKEPLPAAVGVERMGRMKRVWGDIFEGVVGLWDIDEGLNEFYILNSIGGCTE